MNRVKEYVEMIAKFDKDGNMTPMRVMLRDGTIYDIDKVLSVRRNSEMSGNGKGLCYAVCIGNAKTMLYYEEPAWYVERKHI